MADLVGGVHPADRRPGHGPRGRLRAPPPPGAGARPRWSCWPVGTSPRCRRRRPRPWCPSWWPPVDGCRLDDRSTSGVRSAVGRLGAEGRAGPGGGRAPRPGRGPGDHGHPATCGPSSRSRWAEWSRRWTGSWRRSAADLSAEAAAVPGRPHRRRSTTIAEAVEAGRTGFARLPVAVLGPEGEDRLAAESLSVRCLQRADGTLARVDERRHPRRGDRPVLLGLTPGGPSPGAGEGPGGRRPGEDPAGGGAGTLGGGGSCPQAIPARTCTSRRLQPGSPLLYF